MRYRIVELVFRQGHLPRDRRKLQIDGFGVVVERRSFAKDGEGADQRGNGEDPEEESVQHHGDESPVLVLLRKRAKGQ